MDNTRKKEIKLADFYRNSERSKRISIDFDINEKYHKMQLLSAYTELRSLFPKSAVSIQRTRHGFHLKVVGAEIKKIPVKSRITIRETFGDDWFRIELDKRKLKQNRPYTVDVLFESKIDYDGKISHPVEVTPFAMPYCSRIPPAKSRLL